MGCEWENIALMKRGGAQRGHATFISGGLMMRRRIRQRHPLLWWDDKKMSKKKTKKTHGKHGHACAHSRIVPELGWRIRLYSRLKRPLTIGAGALWWSHNVNGILVLQVASQNSQSATKTNISWDRKPLMMKRPSHRKKKQNCHTPSRDFCIAVARVAVSERPLSADKRRGSEKNK